MKEKRSRERGGAGRKREIGEERGYIEVETKKGRKEVGIKREIAE